MDVEIALIISAISVGFAIYTGVSSMRRNAKCDDRKDASQLTTVIVKLENIGNDVAEIKKDMRNVKEDMKDMNIRLVKTEQQVKTLNKTVFKDDVTNE